MQSNYWNLGWIVCACRFCTDLVSNTRIHCFNTLVDYTSVYGKICSWAFAALTHSYMFMWFNFFFLESRPVAILFNMFLDGQPIYRGVIKQYKFRQFELLLRVKANAHGSMHIWIVCGKLSRLAKKPSNLLPKKQITLYAPDSQIALQFKLCPTIYISWWFPKILNTAGVLAVSVKSGESFTELTSK